MSGDLAKLEAELNNISRSSAKRWMEKERNLILRLDAEVVEHLIEASGQVIGLDGFATVLVAEWTERQKRVSDPFRRSTSSQADVLQALRESIEHWKEDEEESTGQPASEGEMTPLSDDAARKLAREISWLRRREKVKMTGEWWLRHREPAGDEAGEPADYREPRAETKWYDEWCMKFLGGEISRQGLTEKWQEWYKKIYPGIGDDPDTGPLRTALSKRRKKWEEQRE